MCWCVQELHVLEKTVENSILRRCVHSSKTSVCTRVECTGHRRRQRGNIVGNVNGRHDLTHFNRLGLVHRRRIAAAAAAAAAAAFLGSFLWRCG